MFYNLITNSVLIIPLCAWLVAELIKVLVGLAQGKRLDLSYFVGSGGMPSAHAAMVSALATATAITNGLGSTSFAISAILALIVMYDAGAVQQSVGRQSVALNRIIIMLKRREPLVKIEADLRELMGHTQFEIIVGAVLGIAIARLWLFFAGI